MNSLSTCHQSKAKFTILH